LFVFPTSYEAFSLASIEAAASGLPVLMPDVSGAKELVGDNVAGAFIRRDPKDIAEQVCRFLSDRTLLSATSRRARQRFEDLFQWDRVASDTLKIYQNVVVGKLPRLSLE
jgi:glycosyltransferase involved in cell wall biosynthesis